MVLSIIEDYKELYKQSLLNESNPNDFHQWEMLKQFQDNWDLSVKRATSIVRLLQDKFNIDGSRLIASGRGDTVPLLPNTSNANRAKNRRTRIVILPNLNKFFALLANEDRLKN